MEIKLTIEGIEDAKREISKLVNKLEKMSNNFSGSLDLDYITPSPFENPLKLEPLNNKTTFERIKDKLRNIWR